MVSNSAPHSNRMPSKFEKIIIGNNGLPTVATQHSNNHLLILQTKIMDLRKASSCYIIASFMAGSLFTFIPKLKFPTAPQGPFDIEVELYDLILKTASESINGRKEGADTLSLSLAVTAIAVSLFIAHTLSDRKSNPRDVMQELKEVREIVLDKFVFWGLLLCQSLCWLLIYTPGKSDIPLQLRLGIPAFCVITCSTMMGLLKESSASKRLHSLARIDGIKNLRKNTEAYLGTPATFSGKPYTTPRPKVSYGWKDFPWITLTLTALSYFTLSAFMALVIFKSSPAILIPLGLVTVSILLYSAFATILVAHGICEFIQKNRRPRLFFLFHPLLLPAWLPLLTLALSLLTLRLDIFLSVSVPCLSICIPMRINFQVRKFRNLIGMLLKNRLWELENAELSTKQIDAIEYSNFS